MSSPRAIATTDEGVEVAPRAPLASLASLAMPVERSHCPQRKGTPVAQRRKRTAFADAKERWTIHLNPKDAKSYFRHAPTGHWSDEGLLCRTLKP
jgi:hypothetical protein